jgi:hypothetical protein
MIACVDGIESKNRLDRHGSSVVGTKIVNDVMSQNRRWGRGVISVESNGAELTKTQPFHRNLIALSHKISFNVDSTS